ncbi:MAG: DUF2203 domain-containing protein [Pyrinomonadaceae bacterium]
MKLFTVAEANALLPTVRGILKRIQQVHRKLASYHDAVKPAVEGAEHGGGGFGDGLRYAPLLIKLTSETSELEVLGVQLKDFGRGLVDFPSIRDGRVVLLCWQLGEGDEVEWWHEVEDGFAGRSPI